MKWKFYPSQLARRSVFILVCTLLTLASAQKGRIVTATVHSAALEQTVTGESPERTVAVYLPPSYDTDLKKRYPVVYLLHGIGDDESVWTEGQGTLGTVQSVMDEGVRRGSFGEMIVVMPDEQTANGGGSYYVDSAVTGNWEAFTTRELIAFVDARYRTLQSAEARGLAGHSMGGYGAITLGMKRPDLYSVVYAMNPALIGWQWGGDITVMSDAYRNALDARSFEELLKLPDNRYAASIVVVAQAFSPNPTKPPFYADLPFRLEQGELVPAEPAFSRWESLNPVNMVPKYRGNLRKLRALRFDSGLDDAYRFIPINSRALSIALTNNGIEHTFEEYNGDHANRMWGANGRLLTEVLPYFGSHLAGVTPPGSGGK